MLRTHTRFVSTRRTSDNANRYNFSLSTSLPDRRRYEAQIERLHANHALTPAMYSMRQDGVPLADLVRARAVLARLLADAVSSGVYTSQPARLRTVLADGKERRVFSYPPRDTIVHGVVADILAEALERQLSPRVFSYRRGVSRWTPITQFGAYLRSHCRSRPDPRTRGVYVIRADVAAYADSIPTTGTSHLWELIEQCVGGGGIEPTHRELLELTVRPEFVSSLRRGRQTLVSGVATGQPIACVLFNLYLGDLDRTLDHVPGGFYARYSDDILFAHPDPGLVRKAAVDMRRIASDLGLEFKDGGPVACFLTVPGRASQVDSDARGVPAVDFLGARIAGDGQVGLKPDKLRTMLAVLESRALNAATAISSADIDHRGRVVCNVLNRCLDPDAGVAGESAALLLRVVTDRRQLAELDYRLARLVARVVTGDCNVRALRRVGYRTIRADWGLRSLLHARNRWKHAGRRR